MNELKNVFNYGDNQVRTFVKDNEVWFIATDVCKVLDIVNSRDAIKRLDDDEKGVVITDTLGGRQPVKTVNESGLYNLIFTSRKEEAKKFKKWVTHDVLPAIRKTGGYVNNDDLFIDTYLPHADEQTKMMFRSTLTTVRKQNERIEQLTPKADYFDALVERNLLTNFRDTAKELHMGQKKFVNWLLENEYLYRDASRKLKPYMKYVPDVFELKEWERNGKAGSQTLITPKGRETFRLLIG